MDGGPQQNKRRGELAELKVAAKVSDLGGTVSFPHGDTCGYDLISEMDGVVKKIQVKCSVRKEGCGYHVNVCQGRSNKRSYTDKECDIVICSVPFGFYVIPVNALKTKLTIRLWEPGTNRFWKKKPNRLYEDFREAWHLLK